jgi:O-antigen/teichoic acid export membrane protein
MKLGVPSNQGLVVGFGVLVRGIAAFALTKSCAALLGPVEFARYGHYLMLATYLLTASSGGLGNAFTVYLGRRSAGPATDSARDSAAVVMAGCGTGVLAALAIGIVVAAGGTGSYLPKIEWLELPAWMFFSVVAGLGGAYLASLLAAQRHLAYQATSAAMPLFSLATLSAFVLAGSLNANRAILSYMLGFGVPAVVFAIGGPALRSVSRQSLASVASFALPYVLPSILIPTVATLSVLGIRRVVAANTTPYDLGLWQALWRLAESYMGVLIAIVSALFIPRLARATTKRDATSLVQRACLGAGALYLPIGLAWLLVPRLALQLLLAKSYLGLDVLLPLQVVGDTLKIVCTVLILTCTTLLRPGLTLLAEIVFNAAFLGLALLFTPRAGAAGAVTAYAAAYGLLLLFLTWAVRCLLRRMPTAASIEPTPPLPAIQPLL